MAKAALLAKQPYREIYVVDQVVGAGGANKRDDVLLVQLLLKIATESSGGSEGFQPPGEPMIEPDGTCGPLTQKYIKYFQEEVNRRRGTKLLEQDGMVDPVRTGAARSALSHTMYTILALNAALRSRRGDTFKIETEPKFPDELKKSIFVDW